MLCNLQVPVFKSQTNREIWFALESNEESLQEYPYEFLLELGYELQENMVIVKWKVTNPASGELHLLKLSVSGKTVLPHRISAAIMKILSIL